MRPVFFAWLRPGFCLLAAVFLNACATRTPPPPAESAAVSGPAEKSPTPPIPRPAPPELRTISFSEPAPRPPAPQPAAEPTRAEKIIRLVRNGGLVQADRNTLVFSRFHIPPPVSVGLFEDGIILGRLRRQLKQIPGLPASVADSARVTGTRAHLTLPETLSCEAAAAAVDAALATAGTSAVHARLFSPATS